MHILLCKSQNRLSSQPCFSYGDKVNPHVPIHINSWIRCTALSEMTLQTNVEQMFAFDRNVLIKVFFIQSLQKDISRVVPLIALFES